MHSSGIWNDYENIGCEHRKSCNNNGCENANFERSQEGAGVCAGMQCMPNKIVGIQKYLIRKKS